MNEVVESKEFITSMVGVLVGGLITLAIQIIVFYRESQIRAKDEKNKRSFLASTLVFKLMRIHSNLAGLNLLFAIPEEATKLNMEPWQYFQPSANLPEDVHFTAEEQSVMYESCDEQVFMDFLDAESLHNAALSATRTLTLEREELTKKVAGAQNLVSISGTRIGGELDEKTLRQLLPQITRVNGLFAEVKRLTGEANEHSVAILASTVAELKKKELFVKNVTFTQPTAQTT